MRGPIRPLKNPLVPSNLNTSLVIFRADYLGSLICIRVYIHKTDLKLKFKFNCFILHSQCREGSLILGL